MPPRRRRIIRDPDVPAPPPAPPPPQAPEVAVVDMTTTPATPPPPPKDQEPSSPPLKRKTPTPSPPPPTLPPAVVQPPSQDVPEIEGPSSRLIISKMVLINFKSYANRQEIGPFHKSFTSVVGPNGSGKSNVIDALLFVFGYRANKMRQGKLSELIHSSTNFPNLDMCAVEVYFQEIVDLPGPDNYDLIPDTQLVVSRQAFRNNTSKYQINGRNSTYTEVTTLLKTRGIDLDHKRFLILQGEVESISLMKPKAKDENDEGLLEYLEDIIGTSRYKEPIENASAEVEKLNEERAERLNRVKYVEKEKNSLETKKQEAEQYLRNENDLAKHKNQLYQMHMYECSENIKIATKAVNDLKGELQQEEDKHKHIKQEVKELEDKYNTTVAEYENIGKETNDVLKELAKYEREDVQLQEKKKHLKTKQKKVTKTLQNDTHARSEHSTWITNHESDLEKRQAELAELERRLELEEAELEAVVQSLNGKTDVFQAQIEERQRALAPWTEKINAKRSQIDVAKSEHDLLAEKTAQAQRAVEAAEEECEELKRAGGEKEKEAANLRVQIETVKRQIVELEANLQDMAKRDEKVRVKLSTARQKADEAKASLQAGQSRGAVLNSLLRMRDSGRIKGIYGRLGNLGVIDDKYDVAISTAAPGLENIVVETVETGQQCIEYLRKNNLGRANFIVLKELPQRDLSPIQTPENVARLFDLVRPKEARFAPAFYSILQNTLVAQDMPQAKRVAYGRTRYKVVTLDGQIIDKSGAMTGGGTRVMRGAMSSKFAADDVKPETVAKLEKEREEVESEVRTFVEQRKAAEKEVATRREEVPKMEVRLEKLGMDAVSAEKRLADAKKRVAELRAQNKPNQDDAKRMRQLQSDVGKLTKELDKLREQSAGLESEIAELQQQIMQVGGARLRDQKAKVTGIREQIDTLNDRITKTQVARTKAEKDLKKAVAGIAKAEQELAEIQSQLEQLNRDIEEKTEAALEIREKADQAKELMERKKEELEEMKALLDEKTAVILKIRGVELSINNKLQDFQSKLKENENKSRHWQDQLSKLSLHAFGEEQEEELQEYTPDELQEMQENNVKLKLDREIVDLESYIQETKPNLSVLEEYRRREQEYLERAKDLEEVTTQRDGIKREYDDLRKRRLDEFMAGFNVISQKLKEMYQLITLGGNAELELVDSLDPFSEGIVFSVMPPKKSWKNISNLSGGEKTLSSLALVFALHHFKPTPLYVMDEIDAALDFRNVSIVANYIKDRTKNAQFVIISLRNNMFELSSRLVGVYKTYNTSKSVSLDLHH